MKIGLVTGEYPPLEGGVGAFTRALAQALADQAHEVHVLTSAAARPADAPRRLNSVREPLALPYGRLHAFARRWRWRDVSRVAEIALRYDLDVVNIQYQAAAFNMASAAINLLPWRLRGLARSVVTFHDLRVPYLFPKAGRLRRRVVDGMARSADGVIATNPEDFAALSALLAADACREIPIGSNIPAFEPAWEAVVAARATLGLESDQILLGYFGFLNPSKGADDLLAALAALDDRFHVVFIGGRVGASDPVTNRAFQAQLDAFIGGQGLATRVHWTGFVADTAVSTWLHAADLLVLPYRDGASLRRGTLMAALAHTRPVITTTPLLPTPALRHGENVWLVPPADPPALAALLRQAAARTLVPLDTAAIEATAALFGWEGIARRTAAFFEALGGG